MQRVHGAPNGADASSHGFLEFHDGFGIYANHLICRSVMFSHVFPKGKPEGDARCGFVLRFLHDI